ncbi:hypothetical protein HYDPIDRAFT_32419 [Hydnomerulius pinastri MD-312]|uniref:NAD-dependent epimerase/dehydratase domain-containing protein n=1 Tax=Hydnomerulius pinastri MD-312 TaxID=994086 RepID=A0A0C9V4D2_9AGAM|nr:hypothetical protein HYDPIDRAFT_32419 [Hydnomerulius pinastri MD-312]
MDRILVTGASGYIGGHLLQIIHETKPSWASRIVCVVRQEEHAQAVEALGFQSVKLDLKGLEAIKTTVVERQGKLSTVMSLADAMNFEPAEVFIEALADVKEKYGHQIHFTSGAKIFSSHVGIDTSHELSDQSVIEIRNAHKAKFPMLQKAVETNYNIIDKAEELGVQSYIVVPPIVCKIAARNQSEQLTNMRLKFGKLFKVDDDDTHWPVCQLDDLVSLGGFYFCEHGSVAWNELYAAIGRVLGLGDSVLRKPTGEELKHMGEALGHPVMAVPIQIAGDYWLRGDSPRSIGWKPEYRAETLLTEAQAETDWIVKHLPAPK